ncbi:transmembrane protein 150C-like, partial [Plectropomus leopardus]|uniref:transmembrane protein 150C-like n=1 Tax=Plectropomus leopardus TaxID=160734 RepID=UPI001C4BC2A1
PHVRLILSFSVTGLIIAVLRYLQVKHRMDKQWINVGSLIAFSVGCFGMTLIGNFQVLTEEMIHNLGTFVTFGLGASFCWVQSYITLTVNLQSEGRKVGFIRFLLSGSITVCMIVCILSLSCRESEHFIKKSRTG